MAEASALAALQQRLGYRFVDPTLLTRALTHRSWGAMHNERLEFLGDALLNLAISRLLWQRQPELDEGDLTRARAQLVREDSLHRVALALGLPAVLRMSEGEARSGGAQRPSLLADALEAVLGAIDLDGGHLAAEAVVQHLFAAALSDDLDAARKDPKTALQEWLQGRRLAVPSYRIVATHGRDHEQTFDVACEVPALDLATQGRGRSRRAAEQDAAQRMLDRLNEPTR
ncbi:MAG: ribonuclease III [Proteobacteria bacterium]|nr:ribonuclease III [Pseudomonadota bacterium]